MDPDPKTHMDVSLLFFVLFFVFVQTSLSESETANNYPTVYEILPKYRLPSGLFPDTVTNFTLSDDGHFIVVLKKPCYVQFEYLVYYDREITGKLGYGSITDIKGIQVQRFFMWFNVYEILVDLPPNDSIYFLVGVFNKKLDVDQFKTVHSCRDGLSSSCFVSSERILQFLMPLPEEDMQMLITE